MTLCTRLAALQDRFLSDNHNLDAPGFVDALFEEVCEVRRIECSLADDGRLRFVVPPDNAIDLELPFAKGKLRMICARLGYICNQALGRSDLLYGGTATIAHPHPARADLAVRLTVRNTHAAQGFVMELVPQVAGEARE